MRSVFALFAASLFSSFAQEILISPETLAEKMKQGQLVILHSGTKEDYAAGHIAGAQLVTLPDLSVTGAAGLRLELPSAEALRATLLKWGISDQTEVVIYAGNDSVQSATRVWFTFDYLSIPARMLNGGLAAWKAKGMPVTQETVAVKAATELTVRPRPELVVDAAWVKEHLNDSKVSLIDARLPEFYSGENPGQMTRGGRIPGAKNLPFLSFLSESKAFLPKEELGAKLGNNETFVTYCHIGMQATVPYFAARVSGKNVKLYDGSFQDWSSRSELPVAVK